MMDRLFYTVFVVLMSMSSVRGQHDQSGEWQTLPPLPEPRQEIAVALLDGKIYVPGGIDAGRRGTNLMEVYDLSTGSWNTAAPMPERLHHFGLVAANDKLYVIGGYTNNSFFPSDRVYEYDPARDDWDGKSAMAVSRGAHTAVAVNGKIHALGGVGAGGAILGDHERYDPETDTWQPLAMMPAPREHLAAAVLDSMLLVAGGRFRQGNLTVNSTRLEAYFSGDDSWQRLADMPTARGGLAAASLNGRLYVFGGEFFGPSGSGVFAETEEYDPVTNAWRNVTPMRTPRHGMGAVTVDQNGIHVIGGATVAGFGVSAAHEIFFIDSATGVDDSAPRPVSLHLLQNYPNPFNPATTIAFILSSRAEVSLTVLDTNGREVLQLLSGSKPSGRHEMTWAAEGFASGVYFYRLTARATGIPSQQTVVQTRKLLLLR